eukprot:c19606_g1_i1.p1 GENE.c19606_g1_i1~~c19606_g1_i1.p1  ORF type:complete len:822 (-),score=155.17 c19606_g1_i1:746-3022(-)
MIVKDLLTCPKVQAVADPTSHLQEIISESALVAFDMYNDLEAKSDEALGTGVKIEAMKKRLAQLMEEETKVVQGDRVATAVSAGAVLDEKLEMSKNIVSEIETRCEALGFVYDSLSTGYERIPQLVSSATSDLNDFASQLGTQYESFNSNFRSVESSLSEHEAFLQANQLEIDALETRLAALKQERAQRIAEADVALNAEKRDGLVGAMKYTKLVQTAIRAEKNLIQSSTSSMLTEWKERTDRVKKEHLETQRDRINQLQTLATILAVWVSKKEAKLSLMENLVENAHQAEREGLQVTFDVSRTEQDIKKLKAELEENREHQHHVAQRLKELGPAPPLDVEQQHPTTSLAAANTYDDFENDDLYSESGTNISDFSSFQHAPKHQPQPYGYPPASRVPAPYGSDPYQTPTSFAPVPPSASTGSRDLYTAPPDPYTQPPYQPPVAYQPVPSPSPYGLSTNSSLANTRSPYDAPTPQPVMPVSDPYNRPTPTPDLYNNPPPQIIGFQPANLNPYSNVPPIQPIQKPAPQPQPTRQSNASSSALTNFMTNEERAVYDKIVNLGTEPDAAYKAATFIVEKNIPIKEAADKLLSGTLYDEKPASTPSTTRPADTPVRPSPTVSTPAVARPRVPEPAPVIPPEDNGFGTFLELQEKALMGKKWKKFYFLLKGTKIVYGEPEQEQLVSILSVLTEADMKVAGTIELGPHWSVFEKEGTDGHAFEIHNPRGSQGQYILRAPSADTRAEWMQRIRQKVCLGLFTQNQN